MKSGAPRAKRPAGDPNRAAPETPGLAVRRVAAKLLGAVIEGSTALDGLTDSEHGHPHYRALSLRDRSLVRAILSAALRHRVTIETLLARRLQRPLPANASALRHVLHVAAAQILFLHVPDSAAVDLAVTQAKADPRTARFASLVNAVLRGLARGKDEELAPALEATRDAPDWFADRLLKAYGPERAQAILAAHRREPPTDFSVKSDGEDWAARLGGIVLPTGSVRVARLPAAVPELPGYDEGAWWVQDAAASLPARLLGAIAGQRVADLCAAPGGKTAQLVLAGASVTALDISASRLARLRANLARLRLDAELVQADLTQWSPPEKFDAVLLDAPCSSTGTVRRHPDVPWIKSFAGVEKLAALQFDLVRAAAGLLRPGGRLVFSNCSLDPLEGEELHEKVLATGVLADDPVAPGELPAADPFLTARGTLRTTPADPVPAGPGAPDPAMAGLDGFFAARYRLN